MESTLISFIIQLKGTILVSQVNYRFLKFIFDSLNSVDPIASFISIDTVHVTNEFFQ